MVGKIRKRQRGQGMTEYIIIVALVAVAAIAVYGYFGETVRNQTAGLAQEVAGVKNSGQAAAQAAAAAGAAKAATGVGMADYKDQVDAKTGAGQ